MKDLGYKGVEVFLYWFYLSGLFRCLRLRASMGLSVSVNMIL